MDTILDRNSADEFVSSKAVGLEAKERLYDSLLRLGNFYQLDFSISHSKVLEELKPFDDCWVQYNPYKPEIPRKGLSVTSLDGKLGGCPDLYSLKEYYRREGALYREGDFSSYTEVYKRVPSIHPILEPFHPYVGRTHFLRFNTGGYFPPHRDSAFVESLETFRLLVPVSPPGKTNYFFMYDGRPLHFESCGVYFLNTLVAHSIFSFTDDVTFLVANISLNRETVKILKRHLWDK